MFDITQLFDEATQRLEAIDRLHSKMVDLMDKTQARLAADLSPLGEINVIPKFVVSTDNGTVSMRLRLYQLEQQEVSREMVIRLYERAQNRIAWAVSFTPLSGKEKRVWFHPENGEAPYSFISRRIKAEYGPWLSHLIQKSIQRENLHG